MELGCVVLREMGTRWVPCKQPVPVAGPHNLSGNPRPGGGARENKRIYPGGGTAKDQRFPRTGDVNCAAGPIQKAFTAFKSVRSDRGDPPGGSILGTDTKGTWPRKNPQDSPALGVRPEDRTSGDTLLKWFPGGF